VKRRRRRREVDEDAVDRQVRDAGERERVERRRLVGVLRGDRDIRGEALPREREIPVVAGGQKNRVTPLGGVQRTQQLCTTGDREARHLIPSEWLRAGRRRRGPVSPGRTISRVSRP